MKFSPLDGTRFHPSLKYTGEKYRQMYPKNIWSVNPWTGKERDPRDIESDPHGILITLKDEPFYGKKMK